MCLCLLQQLHHHFVPALILQQIYSLNIITCNEMLHIIIKHETRVVYCNLNWLVIGHCHGSNHLDRRCLFPSSSLLWNSVRFYLYSCCNNSLVPTSSFSQPCLSQSRFLRLHLIQCFCHIYILHSGRVYTQNAVSFTWIDAPQFSACIILLCTMYNVQWLNAW